MEINQSRQGLWTRDFTIITLGSVVSMIGNSLSGFALSMMVLDYTGSTFLYSLFIVCFQLPMLVCPILAGPYLDRMSRKKVIYRLDFLSAGLYLGLFLLLRGGWFSYPLLLGGCVVVGAINAVYLVAYDSFYPNLITEGNFSKAYSISSMLWPLAAMSTPIAALIYDKLDSATPLFAFNALCFFIAASFERTIRYQETHMDKAPPADGLGAAKRFGRDLREGLAYIAGERGLLVITLYFMVSGFSGSGAGSLYLPFFRNNAQLFAAWPLAAVTLYTIVSNFSVAGRFLGGLVHYKIKFPTEKKFAIAFVVYLTVDVLEGAMLYLPIPLMAVAFFIYGLLGDLLQHPHRRHPVLHTRHQAGPVQRHLPDALLPGGRGRHPAGGQPGGNPPRAAGGADAQCGDSVRGVAVHVPGAEGRGRHLQPGGIKISFGVAIWDHLCYH